MVYISGCEGRSEAPEGFQYQLFWKELGIVIMLIFLSNYFMVYFFSSFIRIIFTLQLIKNTITCVNTIYLQKMLTYLVCMMFSEGVQGGVP